MTLFSLFSKKSLAVEISRLTLNFISMRLISWDRHKHAKMFDHERLYRTSCILFSCSDILISFFEETYDEPWEVFFWDYRTPNEENLHFFTWGRKVFKHILVGIVNNDMEKRESCFWMILRTYSFEQYICIVKCYFHYMIEDEHEAWKKFRAQKKEIPRETPCVAKLIASVYLTSNSTF